MKIVSLDIETTGLDPTIDDILEVGAVFYNLASEAEPTAETAFRCVIVHEDGRYTTTPFCADLHHDLWLEIQDASQYFNHADFELDDKVDEYELVEANGDVLWNSQSRTFYCRPEMIGWCFFQWLSQFGFRPGDRINVAGKNVAMFDVPFLSEPPYLFRETCQVGIRYRVIDPSILFFRLGEDNKLPSLELCLERAGLKPIAPHTALGDALDVIRLLRYALVNPRKELP